MKERERSNKSQLAITSQIESLSQFYLRISQQASIVIVDVCIICSERRSWFIPGFTKGEGNDDLLSFREKQKECVFTTKHIKKSPVLFLVSNIGLHCFMEVCDRFPSENFRLLQTIIWVLPDFNLFISERFVMIEAMAPISLDRLAAYGKEGNTLKKGEFRRNWFSSCNLTQSQIVIDVYHDVDEVYVLRQWN